MLATDLNKHSYSSYNVVSICCINRIFPNLVVASHSLVLNISGSLPFLKPGVRKEIQEIYEGF